MIKNLKPPLTKILKRGEAITQELLAKYSNTGLKDLTRMEEAINSKPLTSGSNTGGGLGDFLPILELQNSIEGLQVIQWMSIIEKPFLKEAQSDQKEIWMAFPSPNFPNCNFHFLNSPRFNELLAQKKPILSKMS